MNPIVLAARDRINATNKTNPAVWTEIVALLQSLIIGCGPAPAHALVTGRPIIARRRLFHEALTVTGLRSEANDWADAAMAVGTQATPEEYEQLSKVNLEEEFKSL